MVLAGPVLKRYPADWQARADLADADAALGMGRLELADAALTRLPAQLSHSDALEAELARARIAAVSGNYAKSVPLFAARAEWRRRKAGGPGDLLSGGCRPECPCHQARPGDRRAGTAALPLARRRAGDENPAPAGRALFRRQQICRRPEDAEVATQNFNDDAARAAQDDMRAAFAKLFLKGGADKMAPVEQLALFYDNVDLTPIGADGDEMIRRMADRLVNVDLLGPAASLLAYQVDKRLDGVAKAQVSTRLAEVYLMDHKPQDAVNALHDSEITGLPDDTLHQRLLLEARAFAALKQWDNALDLIAVDQADDTRRLRADIYWESGNWDVAGQKTEELLGTRYDRCHAAER